MDFEVKRTEGAVSSLPRAQERCDAEEPTDAAQWFARAEELESEDGDAAQRAYRRALEMAPEYADAHYNAARLHQQIGQMQMAVRHFSAYRRLQQ